ncbi:unnamed protein product, partial [Adineta ricciae]
MSPIHVIISGASSVGKSTLVDECIQRFSQDKKLKYKKFQRIQEVARTVLNRLKLTGKDLQHYIQTKNSNAFCRTQEQIIKEQVSYFDKHKESNYLSDRSGFDALAYVNLYLNDKQSAQRIFDAPTFQHLIDQCRLGLIFIVQPQEELQAQNDGMRIVPSYREQVEYTQVLEYWYQQAQLPYFVIADLDMTKRVEFIHEHINGRFHWSSSGMSIPLCLPFHLDKPKDSSCIRYIGILDKQNLRISYEKYDANRLVEKYDPSCSKNKFLSIA